MLGPILPVQLLQQSKSVLWVSSTFFVLARPRPPVTLMSLDRSKRRWEASLSGPTKRWSRRSTSGCTLCQKIFFSRGMRALPKRWNTCMERNGDYIGKWSHCVPFVFNKLRDKKYLRFSFDSPSYFIFVWCSAVRTCVCVCVCVCVRVSVCVSVCAWACVCVSVCVRACVRACVCIMYQSFIIPIFIWSSTCFGWHTAHHQEPKTALAAFGLSYVEGCWTCGWWTVSGTVCLTPSTNYTSNNLPRMRDQRLPVQF